MASLPCSSALAGPASGCMQVAAPTRPSLAPVPAQLRSSSRLYRAPAVTALRGRIACAAPRAQQGDADHPAAPAQHDEPAELQQPRDQEGPWWRVSLPSMDTRSVARRLVGPMAAAAVLFGGLGAVAPVDPAFAADALATCGCLIKKCRGELLRCLGDVNCAANIACLQACNGRSDETECQIGCGDLFANSVVDKFNACAISENPCVPQKPDENLYPIPPDTALVPSFEVERLKGVWYISAGQNPTFDTFDCQLHTFNPTSPTSFVANLTWRIRTPDGGFFTRSADQRFIQQPDQPALLLNHDNEFLHYQDDWYVISSKVEDSPDDYFLVYYRGKNDAWDGYGGAVLYTRSKTVPQSILPEVRQASKAVGMDFDRFIQTDNTCGPQQPLLARLEKKVEDQVLAVEERVLEAGKEELRLLGSLGKGLQELEKDKEVFLKRLAADDKELLEQMEQLQMGGADDLEDLFGNSIPLRRVR